MLPGLMSEGGRSGSEREERGVGEGLRAAVERTLDATAGPAIDTRERAADLLDEVARRGREAREQLSRRGQEAGAGLARRGQATRGELGRQLEALESRLAAIEELLRRRLGSEPAKGGEGANTNPKDKG
jgi:hypothetical protein